MNNKITRKDEKGNNSKMSNITQKWVRVFYPYLEDYSSGLSESEISRKSGVPQQTVSRILNDFVELGLVDYENKGRNKLFFFPNEMESKIIFNILENNKGLKFNMEKFFIVIKEILEYCDSLIVFGSYASGKEKKDSDLDLIILGKSDKKNIRKIKERSDVEINEYYFSFSELFNLLKKKEALGLEVLRNHVVFGDVSRIVNLFWRYYNAKR